MCCSAHLPSAGSVVKSLVCLVNFVIGTSDSTEVLPIRASAVQRIIPVLHNPKLLAANRDRTQLVSIGDEGPA
jgi:hypothetical protein